MKVFGIDPGSERTGYGCVDSDGSRHRLVACGAITTPPRAIFPEKLLAIYEALTTLLAECAPEYVAVENLFYATNVRSALKLGHARGVAILAAVKGGYGVAEYTRPRSSGPSSGTGTPRSIRCRRWCGCCWD